MKIEFNESEFSANMNGFAYNSKEEVDIKVLLRYSTSLISGAISIITSLCLIPLAILVSVLSSVVGKLDGSIPVNYLLLFLTVGVLLACISVIASVFSMIFFAKSEKSKADVIGMILAVLSIVVCVCSFTIGIVSI